MPFQADQPAKLNILCSKVPKVLFLLFSSNGDQFSGLRYTANIGNMTDSLLCNNAGHFVSPRTWLPVPPVSCPDTRSVLTLIFVPQ
jgi:hypothetical protein